MSGGLSPFGAVCLMFSVRIDKNMERCTFVSSAISSFILLAPPVKDDRAQDQLKNSLENVFPTLPQVSVHLKAEVIQPPPQAGSIDPLHACLPAH